MTKRASAVGRPHPGPCPLESARISGGKAGNSSGYDTAEKAALEREREAILDELVALDELHEKFQSGFDYEQKPARDASRRWHEKNARLVIVLGKLQEMEPEEYEPRAGNAGEYEPQSGTSLYTEANAAPLGEEAPPWRQGKRQVPMERTDEQNKRPKPHSARDRPPEVSAKCSNPKCTNRYGKATHVRLGLAIKSDGVCKCGASLAVNLDEILGSRAAIKELNAYGLKRKRDQ